ncbi:MAG: carbamoyltransferase C-terminal domain-containing protein, partial [Pseudomonadota bacterium]
EIRQRLDAVGARYDVVEDDELIAQTADLLAEGKAIGWMQGRMEFGPRALGARSVLADPRSATINDSLNARMERSEFMPFAPYVAAEDADQVFELPAGARAAARFMTITCAVRPEWRERLKAVTHVDGTARPQLITREENPLYYDVLAEFKRRTGAPALVNTSFNAHEEPIINSPAECARALRDDRVDAVLTDHALWRPPGPAARA